VKERNGMWSRLSAKFAEEREIFLKKNRARNRDRDERPDNTLEGRSAYNRPVSAGFLTHPLLTTVKN